MDVIQVKRFVDRIKQGHTDLNYIQAIFEIQLISQDFKNIEESFRNSINNLSGLQNLHTQISNRESANKEKMYKVAKNSKVHYFINANQRKVNVSIKYGKTIG